MIFRNLGASISEAFKNLWRNRLMSFASVTSVMFSLLILGFVFAIIININSFVEGAQDQFEEITIYLQDGLDSEAKANLITDIEGIIGVKKVTFLSKDDALTSWKNEWGNKAYLLDGLDSNPLPDSIIVTLKDLDASDSVVKILETLSGVEDIKFHKDVIDTILSVSRFIRTIGLGIIVILLIVSTVLITNTIKLAVNSREREINIMKYVGATNWYIRRPFMIEGTVLGLVGSLIAAGIIFISYSYMYNYFSSEFYLLIAAHFVPVDAVISDLMTIFVVLGVGIGALGSMNAMRKHLNV